MQHFFDFNVCNLVKRKLDCLILYYETIKNI